jgi:hypothetical protein
MAKKIITRRKAGERPGAPFSEQDPQRRLGTFSGAGEHPRQGSRSAGIVGQTKAKNQTDKGSQK